MGTSDAAGTRARGAIEPGRLYAVPELARLIGEPPDYLWRLARGRKLTVVRLPGKRMQIRGADWLRLVRASVIRAEGAGEEKGEAGASEPESKPAAGQGGRPKRERAPVVVRRDNWRGSWGL